MHNNAFFKSQPLKTKYWNKVLILQNKYPYGGQPKDSAHTTPGTNFIDNFKYWYYVKPTYFFMLTNKGAFWSKPFCVLTTVFKGNREALEFAEKSLDLAAKRLVLNIVGEEVLPSDKWTWSRLDKRRRIRFDNPIDPTYKQLVPVMVSEEMERIVVYIIIKGNLRKTYLNTLFRSKSIVHPHCKMSNYSRQTCQTSHFARQENPTNR